MTYISRVCENLHDGLQYILITTQTLQASFYASFSIMNILKFKFISISFIQFPFFVL